MNLILEAAVPFPPLTIAPAWPILLSGGAVTPSFFKNASNEGEVLRESKNTSNEANNWFVFCIIAGEPLDCLLFSCSSDFPDHDDP